MRVILVTPPYFVLTGPASAASVLTGVLRSAGHDAINFDINRFAIEELLKPQSVSQCAQRIGTESDDPADIHTREILTGSLPKAVQSLRNGAAFDSLSKYRSAQLDVELALQAQARCYGSTVWSSTTWRGSHNQTDPFDVLHAVRSGNELFDGTLERAAELIVDYRPEVIGISLSIPQQLYSSLRLAKAIRDRLPNVHVTIGGATVTRLRRTLFQLPEIFDLIDSVLLREGEQSLLRLLEAIEHGEDPVHHVPELVARRADRVVLSSGIEPGIVEVQEMLRQTAKPKSSVSLDDAPAPVFDDLVPGPHLSPRMLYPLSTTRNCYYNLCPFCSISRSFNPKFREMSVDRIADLMGDILRRDKTALFKDVSEALPPPMILNLCDRLRHLDPTPEWEAYLRFEEPFASPNVAARLFAGGLRVVYFGLESGSQRLVDIMQKRTQIATAERTIRQFAEAGIWIHLFLMAGHPGEVEQDHEQTLEFLSRNREFIHSVQIAGFQMELDSPIVENADRFGFVVQPRMEPSFDMGHHFRVLGQVPDPETVERRVAELRTAAFFDGGPILRASRYIWDAHKIVFWTRGTLSSSLQSPNSTRSHSHDLLTSDIRPISALPNLVRLL